MQRLSRAIAVAISLLVLTSAGCVRSDIVKKDGLTYSRKAYAVGRNDAEQDLKVGRLAVIRWDLPEACQGEIEKLLKKKYQIEVHWVAICGGLTPDAIGHAKGYNDVSVPAIEQRYGKDVLAKAANEAREECTGHKP